MSQYLLDWMQSVSIADLFLAYTFIAACVVYFLTAYFPRTPLLINTCTALLWPGLVILFIVSVTLDTLFPEGS